MNKLLISLIVPLFVLMGCPEEPEDPKDDKKEQNEEECDTADCPVCDDNCERIAECNADDELECDCICDEVTDAGSSEPPVVDAGGEPPTPIVDAGNTEPPIVDAGSGDTPTVDAGSGTTPVVDAGSGALPEVDAGSGTTPEVDAGSGTTPEVDAGSGTSIEVDAGSGDAPTVDSGTLTCPNGTTGDGVTCNDVNECASNNGGCDDNATCTNAAVSGDAPSCECNAGYEGNGQACTDIDECATNNGGCPSNATCTDADTAGVAPLCTCNTGYTEDIMGNCKPDALDWDVEYTDTNHSIFILNTALDGIAQVEAGDYIGVFYARENHFLGCGAFTEWNGETTMLAAQGEESGDVETDGGVTDGVVAGGFEVGEEFHWLFWDASSGNTFSLTPIFDSESPNGNTFAPNGISQVIGFESPNPGWIAEITDNNHSVFIKDTAFDNWPEIESGDYVGVFFEDSASEPQCGGLVKWEGAFTQIPAYGAEGTGIVEGFAVGETFQWRVWDASANTFYEATATYAGAGQDVYAPNGLSFVDELVATP